MRVLFNAKESPMKISRLIEMNRQYLKAGNEYAYALGMSGLIRCAMTEQAAISVRNAVKEDGMVHLFICWNTNAPIANAKQVKNHWKGLTLVQRK
jgi:hypothetical protein